VTSTIGDIKSDGVARRHAWHEAAAGFDWGARTANIMAALWPERCKAMVSTRSLTSRPNHRVRPAGQISGAARPEPAIRCSGMNARTWGLNGSHADALIRAFAAWPADTTTLNNA
jgi:hypothetical protein